MSVRVLVAFGLLAAAPEAQAISGDALCGHLVVEDNTRWAAAELTQVHHDVHVLGAVAQADVHQIFRTSAKKPAKVKYRFRAPPHARLLAVELSAGESAADDYERVPMHRMRARPGNGRQSAGPSVTQSGAVTVAPGDEVGVLVRLEFPTAMVADGHELRLPTVDAACKLPGTRKLRAKRRRGMVSTSSVPTPERSARIVLDGSLSARRVESPIGRMERRGSKTEVTVAPTRAVLTGPVVRFDTGSLASPTAQAHATPPNVDGERVALVQLLPPIDLYDEDARKKQVEFILDRSGSMKGAKLEAAKAAALGTLERMRDDDRFNVIAFSSRHQAFSKAPIAATAMAEDAVEDWFDGHQAQGGTNLLGALRRSLKDAGESGRHRIMVILTDGVVANRDRLVGEIKSNLGESRLFVVGIGNNPNAALIREVAALGRGHAVFVRSPEGIAKGVDALFARIADPMVWDITVDAPGAEVVEQYPPVVADLYGRQGVTVYLKTRGGLPEGIRLRGQSAQGPFEMTVEPGERRDLRMPADD